MTAPAGIQIATDSLRTEAGVWDQQSQQVQNIATTADELQARARARAECR